MTNRAVCKICKKHRGIGQFTPQMKKSGYLKIHNKSVWLKFGKVEQPFRVQKLFIICYGLP
eukprot:UN08647